MKNINDKSEKLATMPLGKLMFSLALPTVCAQLVNLLYSMVDRIYVARLPEVGSLALAGLGVSFPIFSLVNGFAVLAGQGGSSRVAIALGRGDKDQAEEILGNSLFFICIESLVLTAVIYLFKTPLLRLFGASDDILFFGLQYLSIYIMGNICIQIAVGLNSFITAQGFSKTAMITIMMGAIINIFLDPIFIYGLKMGVAGAALATVISQFISALWVMLFFLGKNTKIKIQRKYLHLVPAIFLPILALGISPFIMSVTESGIQIVFNFGMQKYGGDNYVSAMTILFTMSQLLFLPINGITQGCTPIIGFNFGARNVKRASAAFKRLVATTALFAFVGAMLFILFPEVFVGIFTNDPVVLDITCKGAKIYFIGYAFFGAQSAIQSTFIALGEAKISMFIACFRKVILLIPLAIILPAIGFGTTGIYVAEAISDIASVSCASILFGLNIRRLLSRDPEKV